MKQKTFEDYLDEDIDIQEHNQRRRDERIAQRYLEIRTQTKNMEKVYEHENAVRI
jgi:hypothetical protein